MFRPQFPPARPVSVYSSIASQVKEDYGIINGVCLDIGSGRGFLGIALAEMTNLEVCLVDIDRKVLVEALQNAEQAGVKDKITGLQADVQMLPFRNESVDLVLSRGSLFFWEDKIGGLKEIYRILNPSGVAFVGGGLGRYLPEEEREN